MAVYSTNQNRQLYVATGVSTETTLKDGIADIKQTLGKVYVGKDADGRVFINQNGYGGIIISDLIDPDKIMWATASGPKDTELKLKAVTVSLNANFSNSLIAGEDYILRINFRQMYGMSDEDIYQKYGAVHCTSAMVSTPGNFWKAMIYSMIKNFSRLYNPLIEIGVATNTDGINGKSNIVAKATKDNDGTVHLYKENGTEINTTPTAIYIAEKSQVDEWQLGTKQLVPVYFEVVPTTVFDANGDEGVWGTVTEVTDASKLPDPVGNGYKYADLEYFCMGERGDQYRNLGWPKVINTRYFVDPTKTYYSLDIHYAYQGTCEDIQKSEKTITILAEAQATIESIISNMGIDDLVQATDLYDNAKNNDAANAGTRAHSAKSLNERISGAASTAEAAGGNG